MDKTKTFIAKMALAVVVVMVTCMGFIAVNDSARFAAAPEIRSVEHDGHRFVVGKEGAPVHHPDCPCGKAR